MAITGASRLPAIIRENCSHLKPLEREKLLSVLLKFESLFDGTLGDWNLPPISFELKEGTTPYHGKAYPIPQIHKATLMKEISLHWCPTKEMIADFWTKPLQGSHFRKLRDYIMGRVRCVKPKGDAVSKKVVKTKVSFCVFGTHKSGHLCMCGVGVGICIVCHGVCVVLGLGHAKVGLILLIVKTVF